MDLANAILGSSEIDQGNPMNISFLQDLMTPTLNPQVEFDTFCRVIINAFHQHITLPLGSIVTNAATPNNEVLSLVWEQANITTQFWHLLSNVQRIKSLLPAPVNNTNNTRTLLSRLYNNQTMADRNKDFLELMKRFETTLKEDHISYFDKYGTVKTFYFQVPSSVFKPDCVNEPMVLTGTDDVTLLFLVPCKFFTPGLSDKSATALKELQQKTGLPAYLGFFDYIDYKVYFENHTSENRILKANNILQQWVARNIPCSTKKDVMPLEFRRIFKHMANNGRFDIVPEATMAYIPPANGATMELPGFIDPQEDADDSQWFYPEANHYQQLKKDGWRLRFPKASTHTILKWADNFQKLIDGDPDAELETENDPSTYESMKKTTEAAIALFKKEVEKTNVADQ